MFFYVLNLVYPLFSGAKLCLMLDLLGDMGSVTGVDVSRHRLAACRTMLQKYASGNRCRLFVADGTTFSFIPTRVHADPRSCNWSKYTFFMSFHYVTPHDLCPVFDLLSFHLELCR